MNIDLDIDKTFCNSCKISLKELKKRQLNFDTLKKWYEKSKPLYSRKYQNRTLPLIIMFDDIGNINRTVLKDMIALLW